MSGDTSGGVESVERCTCQREKQLFSLFVCQVSSSRRSFLLASLFLAVSMRKLQKEAESMKIKVGRFPWPGLTRGYICLCVHMTHSLVCKGIINVTEISQHNVTRVHARQLIAG